MILIKHGFEVRFTKIDVIYQVSGAWIRTKVESDSYSFTYRCLNKNPDRFLTSLGGPFTSPLVARQIDWCVTKVGPHCIVPSLVMFNVGLLYL